MAKKKKFSRRLPDGIMTIRDLVRELKSNFNPLDNILTITMSLVPIESGIDAKNERTDYFTFHSFSNKLETIEDYREQAIKD